MLGDLEREYFLKTQLAGDKPAKITPRDIAIGCPICREGKSFGRKQRCHLYEKYGLNEPLVHCFNCGWHSNLKNYLKQVDKSLYEEYKRRKKSIFLEKIRKNTSKNEKQKLNNNEERKITPHSENNHSIPETPKVLFDELQLCFKKNVKPLFDYLEKRGLKKFAHLFRYSDKNIFLNNKTLPIKESIIIPLWYKDKIYGFQARKTKEKFFYTFLPEENSGLKVWNYFNVKRDKPVFIFESVFDALSSGLPLENIIAGLGAEIPEHIIKTLKYPIFAFDNPFMDTKAREKYLQLIDRYHCVIWGKDLKVKDFNELLQFWDFEQIKNYILKNVKKGLKAKLMLEIL